jgi:5-methyltetrahydrofolate--homocysteine methyltransferase
MTRSTTYTRGARLPDLLQQRIVVIDGAMGTMLQARKLGEADYRGERFAEHTIDLRGNGDVLNLTRPDVVREIHLEYLHAGATSSRPTPGGSPRDGLAMHAREMTSRRHHRARGRRVSTPERP